MFLPRLLTAIIGIPLILITIHFGGIPYFIMILVIVVYMLKEYLYLTKIKYQPLLIPSIIFGLLLFISMYLSGTKVNLEGYALPVAFTTIFLILFLCEMVHLKTEKSISRMAISLLGIFITVWPMGHLLFLREMHPCGKEYTYFIFLLLWTSDTSSYLIGSNFGKRRLLPKVSPKKTIEGAIGGLFAGLITGIILWQMLSLKEMSFVEILLLSFGIVLFGQMSDLAESLIKRDVGLKESDVLLPGQGGMLDRFDSFIFTAPLYYYYLVIFHK